MSNQYTKKSRGRILRIDFKFAAEGHEVWEALVKEFGESVARRIADIVWGVQSKHTQMRDKAHSKFGAKGRAEIGESTRKRVKDEAMAYKREHKRWPLHRETLADLLAPKVGKSAGRVLKYLRKDKIPY